VLCRKETIRALVSLDTYGWPPSAGLASVSWSAQSAPF
jgi:hypothetical protein